MAKDVEYRSSKGEDVVKARHRESESVEGDMEMGDRLDLLNCLRGGSLGLHVR